MSSSQSSSKSSSKSSSASSSQSSSNDRKEPSKDRQKTVNQFKLARERLLTSPNCMTITNVAFEMKFNPAGAGAMQPKNTPPTAPPSKPHDVKPRSPKPPSRQN